MCRCLQMTELELQSSNLGIELDVAIVLIDGTWQAQAKVATVKQVGRKRKPANLIATYCPFCGEKYPISERENMVRQIEEVG